MSGFTLKFLQDVNQIVNEAWDMGSSRSVKEFTPAEKRIIEANAKRIIKDLELRNTPLEKVIRSLKNLVRNSQNGIRALDDTEAVENELLHDDN